MMTTAKIFDTGMSGAGVELEIAQSAIRVLLSCVASEDKDVSTTHLHHQTTHFHTSYYTYSCMCNYELQFTYSAS